MISEEILNNKIEQLELVIEDLKKKNDQYCLEAEKQRNIATGLKLILDQGTCQMEQRYRMLSAERSKQHSDYKRQTDARIKSYLRKLAAIEKERDDALARVKVLENEAAVRKMSTENSLDDEGKLLLNETKEKCRRLGQELTRKNKILSISSEVNAWKTAI